MQPVPEASDAKRRRLTSGVRRLMEKLQTLRPEGAVRKGMTMKEFFATRRYWRRTGERISDYLVRFDEGVNQLVEDGVDLTGVPDLLGFFFFYMLNLSPERQERLLGTLPDEHYRLPELKRGALRLFHDLREVPLPPQTLQQRYVPRDKRGRWTGRRRPRAQMAYEACLDEPQIDCHGPMLQMTQTQMRLMMRSQLGRA